MSNRRHAMPRDEWNRVLDTTRATRSQRGAVMRECDRLGLADRAERLAVCAELLGINELRSTEDLTMGQAGQLVRVLAACSERSQLPAPRRPRLSPIATLALALGAAAGAWGAPPRGGGEHPNRR
jgi:hypothetical protein